MPDLRHKRAPTWVLTEREWQESGQGHSPVNR